MASSGFFARHRARLASGVAVALAVGVVTAYAITAEGYRAHQADLNDGGVWVVNGAKGWSGRVNKPINQIDGVIPGAASERRMDVLQDGAAVVTLDLDAASGQSLETARLSTLEGGAVSVPADADLAMAADTLASIDRDTGRLWALRYDARVGRPQVSGIDRAVEPLETVGAGASLAVSQAGEIVAVSSAEASVTRIAPGGTGFARARSSELPDAAGEPSDVTTVGRRVVTLDQASGALQVLDGPSAVLPSGAVLQQPGPEADTVLVGTSQELLAVDLASGDIATVAEAAGTPVAPVRLGACTYGAWSGGTGWVVTMCGTDEATPQQLGGDATELAFRVNRGEIVLNDALSGSVWDVDLQTPARIDNWESFTHRKKKKKDEDKEDEDRNDADRRPPKAQPDSYGVRAGRATVLHPLDNDSAPDGRLLSIVGVDPPGDGSRVDISPDGQTLVVRLADRVRTTSFEYHIDDGRSGLSAHAPVTVTVRGEAQNVAPRVRKGYRAPELQVPNGGALSIPVLADWRDDDDGDSLVLESAVAVDGEESGVRARQTADGRIRINAPALPDAPARSVRVDYTVSDGRSAPVAGALDLMVQSSEDRTAHPPVAQPDMVRGEVGEPIELRPLLNDLPGSDPGTPNAELSLGGKVPGQPGLAVKTDVETGSVHIEAERPGTYFLNYDAAFGAAPLDKGTVRLDVKPRPRRVQEPVPMPDTLTVFGQAPGVVDVLANDLDPAGRMLTVQRAVPQAQGQLDVAIVEGRWLRVSALTPTLQPATQTVAYTVTNGSQAVQGELVVTQRPAPEDNTPITVTDRVVVRSGASVSVPVLDNDVSPGGDRLSLLTNAGEEAAGRLRVVVPAGVSGDVGQAFVAGRMVRYVAPAGHTERDTFEIPYVAQNEAGDTAQGRVLVTIVPQDAENHAPEPPLLEGRTVAGDEIRIKVPGVGIDLDGDPVTVTGITSAPKLGRIVATGGNFLEYEAYPRVSGTDEFQYAVVDAQGAVATGTVRIAIVAPSDPQPPLAVADRLVVAPGRLAVFDPLGNDFVAPGDRVSVELLDAPPGVEVDPDTNFVTLEAPDEASAPTVQVVYRLTNGLAESRATLSLEVQEGHNNPPVVYDAYGRAEDGRAVEVDVLEGAYDPDGPSEDLEVLEVLGDPTAVVEGSTVVVERGEHPKVVPFSVRDAEGGVATASIYVPPSHNSLPYVDPDALITLDSGKSFTGELDDFIEVPGGRSVRLVEGPRAVSASPSVLSVQRRGEDGFIVSAPADHRGPGAVLVEVTTAAAGAAGEDPSDPLDGVGALLSIPVRVGDDTPVLQCPDTPLSINVSQRVDLDIATLCSVWTLDPRDAEDLDFTAEWTSAPSGLDLAALGGSRFAVTAAADAVGGGEATLEVRAGGSNAQQVRFRLVDPPSPSLMQIPFEDMEAGQSRTVDLAPYLRAGLPEPSPTVVSVSAMNRTDVRASISGSRVTFRAPEGASGVATFRVVMSDIAAANPPAARQAEGRIQFDVGGVPAPPTNLAIFDSPENNTIELAWLAPRDDGGSRIRRYEVREIRFGRSKSCVTTRCTIGNLEPGRRYVFQVRAWNRTGPSEWSERSREAQAATKPGTVRNIRMVSRADGTIKIAWDKPYGASNMVSYEIRFDGRTEVVAAPTTEFTAVGLNNNRTYEFRIRANNEVGTSAERLSEPFQSIGTPAAPMGVSTSDLATGTSQTTVQVTWNPTLAEGPGNTLYTLRRSVNGGPVATVPGCARLAGTRCQDSGVVYDGSAIAYTVVAHNERNTSPASAPGTFDAVGSPADWGAWTATATGEDREVAVRATVPDPRGSSASAAILVDGREVHRQSVSAGQVIERSVTVPTNESPADVQLRLCNEYESRNGCTTSDVKSVQTWGRFRGEHLDAIQWSANGRSITINASGTSNGNAGVLRYEFGSTLLEFPLSAAAAFRHSITFDLERYRQDETVKVTLFDDNPLGRGASVEWVDVRSADPPPAQVHVSRGAACLDGPEGSTACGQFGYDPDCTVSSCAFINVRLEGWGSWMESPEPTCTLTHPDKWFSARRTLVLDEGTPGDTWWYARGGTVTVTCSGGGTTASGQATWQAAQQ